MELTSQMLDNVAKEFEPVDEVELEDLVLTENDYVTFYGKFLRSLNLEQVKELYSILDTFNGGNILFRVLGEYLVNSKESWFDYEQKSCRLCGKLNLEVYIHGKTKEGKVTIMCEDCFSSHGVGLGENRGQRYRFFFHPTDGGKYRKVNKWS